MLRVVALLVVAVAVGQRLAPALTQVAEIGPFRLRLPPAAQWIPREGIDSVPALAYLPTCDLHLEYGIYGGLPWLENYTLDSIWAAGAWQEALSVVKHRGTMRYFMAVNVVYGDAAEVFGGLVAQADCKRRQDLAQIRRIFGSIEVVADE